MHETRKIKEMVSNIKQLHGTRRVYAPEPSNARGFTFDISPLRERSGYRRNSTSPNLPRNEQEGYSPNLEEDFGYTQNSFGEIPWLVSVESQVLHERGSRRFRRRYGEPQTNLINAWDFDAIINEILNQ